MRAVLYLDRSTLHYYGGGLPQVTSLEIPPLALQDMEVIDSAELTRVITEFFQTHKIKPAQTVLCFSSRSYFIHDLPAGKTAEELKSIEEEFVENIPFNKTLCKTFIRGNAHVLIGINREVLFVFQTILRTLKHPLLATIPSYALFGETTTPFSKTIGQEILKHSGSLGPISFELQEEKPSGDPFESVSQTPKKQSNTRLYLLVGVFGVLICILVAVYFLMGRTQAPKPPREVPYTPPSVVKTAPAENLIPTTSIASPSPELDVLKSDLTIQIVNGSGVPGEATRIKNRIAEAGFTKSSTNNTSTQVGDSTLIIVKPSVSRAHQEELVTMLRSLGMTVVIRENEEISEDIRITTYKTSGSPTIQTQETPTP